MRALPLPDVVASIAGPSPTVLADVGHVVSLATLDVCRVLIGAVIKAWGGKLNLLVLELLLYEGLIPCAQLVQLNFLLLDYKGW